MAKKKNEQDLADQIINGTFKSNVLQNQQSNQQPVVQPNMSERVVQRANELMNIGNYNEFNSNKKLAKVSNPLIISQNKINFTNEEINDLANMQYKDIGKTLNSLPTSQKEKTKLFTQISNQKRLNENAKKAEQINKDISEGKYGSSITHVLSGVPAQAKNYAVDIGNALLSLNPQTKDRESLVSTGKSLSSQYNDVNAQIENKFVNTAGRISGTIGGMLPSIAINLATAGTGGVLAEKAGTLAQGIGVGASGYLENLNEEQNNKVKSFFTGLAKGGVSYKLEGLTGGNILSKGSIDDIVKSKIAQSTLKEGGKWLASKAYEFGGEIAEENLENLAGYLIDKVINGKNITLKEIIDEAKQTSSDTFWTTLVLNALGIGGNTYQEIRQTENINQAINNSNLGEKSKESLTRAAEKNGWTAEEVQKMIEDTTSPQNQLTTIENKPVLENNQQTIRKNEKVEESSKLPQSEQTAKKEVKLPQKPVNEYEKILNDAKFIPENEKQSLLKDAEGASIEDFKYFVEQENEVYKEQNDNILDTDKTYSNGRKETYTKYMQAQNEYDRTAIDKAKDTIQGSKRAGGRRTKAQWLQIANMLGTEIADKSNSEIEEIAYKTWQDERPNAKTSINREGQSYVPFNSDEWINQVYNAVKKARGNIENNQQTEYNNIKLGETKKVSVNEMYSLYNGGGYKTLDEIADLKKSIEANGIKEPIEIYQKKDGTYAIENGNHRLQIAKELGMKDVPVKLVESWEKIGLNKEKISESKINEIGEMYNDRTGKTNSEFDDKIRAREGRLYNIDKQFENGKRTETNVGILEKKSESNQQTSNIENERDNRTVKNSQNEGSFNLPQKAVENMLPLKSENITENNSQYHENLPQKRIVDEVYKEEINEGKTRKHYQSVFESDQVGKVGKEVAKNLYKTDTYTPISNVKTISEANSNIQRNGAENTYISFMNKMNTNERITLQDIATGERLIQIYSQNGEYSKVNDLVETVAILGTELGQQVQALSLIKKASPEGQLSLLKKIVERTNIKENTNLEVTDEMAKKILESKNQNELQENISEIAEELGNQLPIKTSDKIRSWRYLSMLGNPRTHIRNIGANIAMNVLQNTKNAVAGATEDIASVFNKEFERTKTLKRSNKDQVSFAKQDAIEMQDLIDGGGKYDIQNMVQSSKRSFDNNVLNAITEFNSNMLDLEDKVFLKKAYQQALQNYMTANKLSSTDMTGQTLEKARQYASLQAQEATFHQFSSLANTLSAVERKGGVGGKLLEAILPFKKTPINIAKAGVEYSPIGLVQTVGGTIQDITKNTQELKTKLEKGNITQEQYKSETSKMITNRIDQMSKGLTGTGIALIGYALAKSGILKAGNDDEKDEFEGQLGNQEYSIKIGDNTYTLDWLSPSAIPLFVGATVQGLVNGEGTADEKDYLGSLATGFAKAFEPMTEMSMLQGLTSAISSYEQGSSNMIFDIGASSATSYIGQFVPTALGQVTKTIDPYVRDTTSTKKGIPKKVEQLKNQTMSKVPGLSNMLPVKTDIWGKEKKRAENPIQRYVENAILPYNREKLQEDMTSEQLKQVFEETGENSVLPKKPQKNLTINKEKYTLTSEEYADLKKEFGSTSKNMLDKLIVTSQYKNMSSDEKAEAIEKVYEFVKEKVKVTYSKQRNLNYKSNKKAYKTIDELTNNKQDASAYIIYSINAKGLTKKAEKINVLNSMKINSKAKNIIYQNVIETKK